MGSKSSASTIIEEDCIKQGNRLNVEQQVRLIRPFSMGDVKKAMFSIHSSKSPGLDGFGSSFFKDLWSEIGNEVSKAILDFFDTGYLPNELNETVISLIPKVSDPNTAKDYRPIACCNTVYKYISKMICSRLTEVLPSLIQGNQGAFIKNRLLAHNIMIFQDLLKGYTRKNVSARCILKIDLSKAYDTVDWQFVEDMLNQLCFPSRFVNWIMTCLKGTQYHLLMNGRIQGSFRGKKGLRQGDPMSPLLFVLIMEYLSRLLSFYSEKEGFGYHPLCKHLRLTNLFFADDLVLFSKGNLNSVKIIQEAFTKFCNATGLSANKAKSQIFFGGVKEDVKQKILELVQIEEGNLSFTGRAQLIHSVLLGIRNYWMSIFIIPQKIVEAVDKSCRDFLWGKKENKSKFHLAFWEKVCLPKKLGGIGFREGKKWNKALIAKYLWAISSKQDNLWVKWVNSIYLKGQSIWSYHTKQDATWYFKKLLNLRVSTSEAELNLVVNGKKFHASKFYNMQLKENKVNYVGAVWDKLVLPKHRFIYWQVVNTQLITRDLLNRFVSIQDVNCPVCNQAEENHKHVFFECPFSKQVAAKVKEWLGQVHWPISVKDLNDKCSTTHNNLRNRVINFVIAASLYQIWLNRNDCIFNLTCATPCKISRVVRSLVKIRILCLGPFKEDKMTRFLINVVKDW
uniref:Reverse transcriptase domain-containing protein n=1 Tax=Cannabis sativa TaxID=3483 RepID=A0A803PY01_CANSA